MTNDETANDEQRQGVPRSFVIAVSSLIRISGFGFRVSRSRSQRAEERDQIGLLLVREADVESCVVEVDDGLEVGARAVVEVRGAGGEAAQDRALELADVLPAPGEQGAAGVGGGAHLAGGLVAQGV